MKELTMSDIKSEELKILASFDAFCKDNHLKYSLAGGTLLGAIRHNGFIPWDDDIDLIMPRKDYEEFIQKYSSSQQHFKLVHYTTNANYPYPFAKIVSPRTYLYETFLLEQFQLPEMGIWVDIFPSDYIENPTNRIYWFKQHIYRVLLRYRTNSDLTPRTNLFHRYFKAILVYLIRNHYSNALPIIKGINRLAQSVAKAKTKKMGCLVWGYKKKEICNSSLWDDLTTYKFENLYVKGFKNDEYLHNLYGDYMQLPPKSERIPHHEFKAFWRK